MLDQSALSLATSIRQGKLSCREVTRFFLDRIARFNPELNAFVEFWEQRAMFAAARRDLYLQVTRDVPPLFGVPIGVKDLQLIRGARSRFGSAAMPFVWSPIDDRVVSILRKAGVVFVGKLATSEMGVMPVVEPEIHPPTRNPWDLNRSSGGSSGGSGAAVASGMLPFAHGSDGAGSIRIPASLNGLVGIKASRGLVRSNFGESTERILHCSGPIAHGVEDAAALLDAFADSGGRYLSAARGAPLGRLRVGLCVKSPVAETNPTHAAAAERVAKILEARGCTVIEIQPPEGSVAEFLPLYGRLFSTLPLMRWERAQPISRWVAEHGKGLTEEGAHALQDKLSKRFTALNTEVDLVITPTTPESAPLVGAFHSKSPEEGFLAATHLGAYTAIFNITGQPALSLPILDSGPLPIGVQLAAKHGNDALIITAARLIEQELGGPSPVAPQFR
jgi:amidase